MQTEKWLTVLACVSLIVYLLLQRVSARSADTSVARLALLTGTRRVLGETDASLKRRSISLSRWPYTKEEPEVAWWARLFARVGRRFGK